MDFHVTTDAQMRPAWLAAKPGDTILLASTVTGAQRVTGMRWAEPGVTFKPEPGAKVVLAGFTFDGVAGATLQDVEINAPVSGVIVGGVNPERIHLKRLDVHGAITDDPAAIKAKAGIGVSLGNGTDITLEDSRVHHIGSGVNGGGIGQRVLRNTIDHINADGIHFGPVSDLLIEGNTVTDIFAAGSVHLDAIQITSAAGGGKPKGVVIRRNQLIRGKGLPFQGIFFSDATEFLDVVIEENLVAGGSYQGIGLYAVTAPVVRGNYVTGDAGSLDGAKVMVPWIKLNASPGAVVTDNITTNYGPTYVGSPAKLDQGNTTVPLPAAGDFSAGLAWFAKLTAPAPEPDPRDVQIADLTAQLAEAAQTLASARTTSTSLKAAIDAAEARSAALADKLSRIAAIAVEPVP